MHRRREPKPPPDSNPPPDCRLPYKVSYRIKPTAGLMKIQTVLPNDVKPGYTRIALGHPVIPRCREICIEDDHTVYAVVDVKPYQLDLHMMEPHVCRKAFLFPEAVVNQAVNELHLQNIPLNRKYEAMTGTPAEIRQLLLNQFPDIELDGADTAGAIIRQAWDPKHPERVGNARMPLVDQIQMAVNAYIRHEKSNYETLFKVGISKRGARAEVRMTCIRRMSAWRREVLEIPEEHFDTVIEFYDDDPDDDDPDNDDGGDGDDDDVIEYVPLASLTELDYTLPKLSPVHPRALPGVSPSGIPILVYGSDGRAFETDGGELQIPTYGSPSLPLKVYGEDGRVLNPNSNGLHFDPTNDLQEDRYGAPTQQNSTAEIHPSRFITGQFNYDVGAEYQSTRSHSSLLNTSSRHTLRYGFREPSEAPYYTSHDPTHLEPYTIQPSAPPGFHRVGGDRPYDLIYDDSALGLDSIEVDPFVVYSDIPVNAIFAPKPVYLNGVWVPQEDEIIDTVEEHEEFKAEEKYEDFETEEEDEDFEIMEIYEDFNTVKKDYGN